MSSEKFPWPDLPKYEIVFSSVYRKCREDVFEYIHKEWWENSVENFSFELKRRLSNLQYLPNDNPRYHINDKYRFFPIWGYLVLFFVDDEKRTVVVDRVYHGSRNIEELLKKEDK